MPGKASCHITNTFEIFDIFNILKLDLLSLVELLDLIYLIVSRVICILELGQLVLEWSDDIITWTERITTTHDGSQTHTDVYVASDGNWTSGAFYQVAFTAESEKDVLIEGVTPGSAYNIHCLSTDSSGSSGPEQQFLSVTTADFVSPILLVSNVSASDYSATLNLHLQDPGKAYPALTTCVAREVNGSSLAASQISSKFH